MKKNYRVVNHTPKVKNFTAVRNVAEFADAIAARGDKCALVWKYEDVKYELSYRGFYEKITNFAAGIKKLSAEKGYESGTRIALVGDNCGEWLAAYLGIIYSGNTVVPMDKEVSPEETEKFLESVDAKMIIYSDTFNKRFSSLPSTHKSIEVLIPMHCTDKYAAADGVVRYSDVEEAGKAVNLECGVLRGDTDEERCCEMLFTSGTTGSSKCVMLCQRNIFSVVTSACETISGDDQDVLVSVLPVHHTYALAVILIAMDLGMKICINDSLKHVMNDFKEYHPTILALVPLFVETIYKKIITEAKKTGQYKKLRIGMAVTHALSFFGIDLSEKLFAQVRESLGGSLRTIISGGAALNPAMIPFFENFGISIYEGYGITECSPLVSVTPVDKRKCGSVGPSISSCEVRIDENGVIDDGNRLGEIQVKGKNVMLGYHNNPAANAEVFSFDGWFGTGDIGYIDEDGYIFITGRKKNVIVLENGKNVFPEEIEEYLSKIDMIAESVVIGREDDEGHVTLTSVIYPAYDKYSSMDADTLHSAIEKEIAALNKKVPTFKRIRKIEFRDTPFEKTTTKKIKRHLVK